MSFIDNFKNNFNQKVILSHIDNNNSEQLLNELQKLLSKDPSRSYDLIYSLSHKIINLLSKGDLLPTNIFWINSYELEENIFIENFLKFYFEKNKPDKNFYFNSLERELFNIMKDYKKNIDISFTSYVNESDFYQLLISLLNRDKYIFLSNQMAFYEHNSGKFFTTNNFTKAYIYVLKNPYSIYGDLKKNNEKLFAQNYLMNLDQRPIIKNIKEKGVDFNFESNRQSWSTNISSWDNANVMNTFRGLIVKLEDVIEEPIDNLANVISHLIQAGINLKLDYNTIEEFIKKVPPPKVNTDYQISQKEKKLLAREISSKAEEYNYLNN